MQVHKMMMLGALLSIVVLPVPHPSAAQPTTIVPATAAEPKPVEVVKKDGETQLKLNFQDAPLQTVLEYLSEAAGLTVVSDQPLTSSRITVISRQPMALDQAVSLINSALKEKGSTTVLIGTTLKVVTLTNAKKENIPVLTGRDPEAIVPSDDVVSYVIPVSHVTATALKQNLEALRPEYASIEANEDGNALIVTDTLANIKRLMQIVVALDTHMATVAEIRVFRLVSADATSAATLINSIFQQQAQSSSISSRGGQRGGRGGAFGPGGPMEMLMQMRNQNRGGAQSGATINVQVVAAADERTNSVVVRGSSETLDLVADMIKALDDTSARVTDVRVFQLRYADAMNAADVVNQLFGQQATSSSRSSRGGRGANFSPMMFRGPFGGGAQQGNGNASGGSTLQVSAAADSRTNTVVVTGPESVLNIVEDVIKKLDMPLADMADVKVFHLEYADAQDSAELINEVFGQSRTSSSRSSRSGSQQNQRVMFMRGGSFGGQQAGDTGGASSVEIIASADSRTNSVVVSGPASTLEVIAQIIKQLDENPEQERRIFVYALKNANATNLMTILNNLFTEMQALSQRTLGRTGTQFQGGQRGGAATAGGGAGGGGGGGAAGASGTSSNESLSEETYCQADPNTNSLLVMTSTKNYLKIKPIIEELDKPVGQVLIKVLFAEVTHSNSVDLGTEFSMVNLNSNGRIDTTEIFGKPNLLVTEGGQTKSLGLSVRAIQGDIDLTIRALQETGKLNVLSRPYVLTQNNQMATITVAEEVPIPTSSTTQGTIGSTTTFTYRNDIGIVLEVTPSINPEGLVNMTVTPKITTRTGETVQISEGLNPSVFATRSASTRVAVLDGQTIVIGGLIEDQLKITEKKVPLLGDIPLAGVLFKRSIHEKTKTELLIFLTPRVAQEPKVLTSISDAERVRSNLNTDEDAATIFKRHLDDMQDTGTPNLQIPAGQTSPGGQTGPAGQTSPGAGTQP
jgi:general secretion pathway protein D